jgi:glycosyltransferase involved in cell wall biosynthesis
MMPRRILHLITTSEADGAQTQLAQLSRHLDAGRYQIHIGFLFRRGTAFDRATVPIHDFSLGGRPDPFALLRILKTIRAEKIDLVHTHLVHAGVLGKLAARLGGSIPVVTTRHYASEGKDRSALYRLEDRMTAGSAAVIAISESVRAHLIGRGIASARQITVIPNGVDLGLFDPVRFERQPRMPDSGITIGSVGRLAVQKGHSVLLDAAQAIFARFPSARIEIVGEGPLRGNLEAQARRLGIEDRLLLRGSVPHEEMPALLSRWDLMVMPSRWEGFGVAAAEAMAMEKAVVASAVEGMAELIQDGTTGALVQPERPDALAGAVIRILDDGGQRLAIGRAARRRVQELFSIGAAAAQLERLYDSILETRPSLLR